MLNTREPQIYLSFTQVLRQVAKIEELPRQAEECTPGTVESEQDRESLPSILVSNREYRLPSASTLTWVSKIVHELNLVFLGVIPGCCGPVCWVSIVPMAPLALPSRIHLRGMYFYHLPSHPLWLPWKLLK